MPAVESALATMSRVAPCMSLPAPWASSTPRSALRTAPWSSYSVTRLASVVGIGPGAYRRRDAFAPFRAGLRDWHMPSPDSLRIAWLVYRGNPHCGGQGVYTRYLARELTALGHEVTVFSGPPYPELDDPSQLH